LADEGLDLLPLRSLIVALGGNSRTKAFQRIGRLVRLYPGKGVAIAFDTWDSAEFLYKQASQEEAA
jgi:superfamily II DNA or RNA helicase